MLGQEVSQEIGRTHAKIIEHCFQALVCPGLFALRVATLMEKSFDQFFAKGSSKDADLFGANLGQADLTGTDLGKADLRNTDLSGAKWQEIAEIKLADVFGVKSAPPGFLDSAAKRGAVSVESDAGWLARFNLD